MTELCEASFCGCVSLSNVVFEKPCSISYLNSTFIGCSSLKQISIPSSVTSIGVKTFDKCISLIHVDNQIIVENGNDHVIL